MNSYYTRTDLASECTASYAAVADTDGFRFESKKSRGFDVSVLDIINEQGARSIGKPRGRYITVSIGKIWHSDDDTFSRCSALISDCLCRLSEKVMCKEKPDNILVAGLGNRYITSDAIGHETLKNVIVTRHLKDLDKNLYDALGSTSVSAITPGVIGQTGIETLELIRGAVKDVKPDIVIVIDALVARDLGHLATTVQITDSGIAPGSGIGNRRHAINRESLGCPVLAIGVPTVVESSTLVYSALEKAGITDISSSLKNVLDNGRSFFVTPKESDTITIEVSRLIADSINMFVS